LTLGADGTLYVAQNGGVFDASGTAEPGVQVISDRRVDYLVAGMGAPNDLVFGPDGRLWVTDIRREIDPALPGDGLPGQVWAVDVASASAGMVVEAGPVFVNGLGFTRDKRTLLVTATMLSEFLALSTAGCGAGHEHQSKFSDLHLVAVGQHSRVDGFTVDIDAVEVADFDNPEFGVDAAEELGVLAADGDVVEEDIAIRLTSGRRDGLVEREPRPGVGAPLHHQQRRALRRALRTEKLALGAGGGRSVMLVAEVGTKRGGPLPGDFVRALFIVVIGHWLLLCRCCSGRVGLVIQYRGQKCEDGGDRCPSPRGI
jgi:hypothetical protein